MAPEQMLGEEAAACSDIYSFGVMLREMLGGAPAPGLDRVVKRCLEREPENRWHSAGDLKAALEMCTPGEAAARPLRTRIRPPAWTARAAAAAALCLGLAGTVVWRPFEHPPSRLAIPTQAGGTAGRLSVSPAGDRVAYTMGNRVWVRALAESESRPVEGTEGAASPFWSPDGKYLAFAAGGTLRKVAAAGGLPQTLCDIHTNAAGAWGPGGDILIGQIGDGIFRVPAGGGEPVRLTRPDPKKYETRHMLPQFLPGGRKFLYVAGSDRPGFNVLWASTLDGVDRKALMTVESGVALAVPARGRAAHLIYMLDRALVTAPFDLDALERNGPVRTLAPAVGSVASLGSVLMIGDFSASGNTLAYRASAGAASALKLIATPARPAPMAQMQSGPEITVLRDWM
jgi:hypothetical protein